MSERWHMNRIGFVNFWLYDDEVFSFADGKLLLRGQNGSGKSITTQSFIPFILDGDRTPSRLDPFGSSDRRMEYYFLNDGEKEEATGYLYLEFRKGNRYRTIGIGQQAQKGKAMGFWGFLVLDGRRIGYDFNLYRDVGNTKIVYTKQEIKKELGENNLFTEAQKEYMGLVNKHIFGFPRLEQYEQFIRLLIKVRAPKLSKEFTPKKVYEILNDSLQTLSDEDLRAMVDAMEKMDDIQDKLNGLKRAYKDLQIIRNEYVRYNQYMLGQKAIAYLEEKAMVDAARGKLEAETDELKETKEKLEKSYRRAGELKGEKSLLEREKEAIGTTDLEEAEEKLRTCRKRQEDAQREIALYCQGIEHRRNTIREYDAIVREIQKNIDAYQMEIEQLVNDMDELQNIICFSGHGQILSLWKTSDGYGECKKIKSEIEKLCINVQAALDELKKFREIQIQCDRLSKDCSSLEEKKAQAWQQVNDAETMEDALRDDLIEAYYGLEQLNQEFYLSKKELEQISIYIQKYQDVSDYGNIRNLIGNIWEMKNQKLGSELSVLEVRKEKKAESVRICREELEELEKVSEITPVRREILSRTREKLAENNISFSPFYEAVDFTEHISMRDRDLLECQLEDAGLLDALVVPQKDYTRAMEILEEWSDKILCLKDSGKTRYSKLAAVAGDMELRKMTERILSNIGEEDDCQIVLKPDGYFRHGALEGYSRPEREACYIGEAIRKEKKKEQIRRKKEELQLLQQELEALGQEIDGLRKRIGILQEEYHGLPVFDELDEAIAMKKDLNWTFEKCSEECGKKQKEKEGCEIQKKQSAQRVIAKCRELPYERNIESYEEILGALYEYKGQLESLQMAVMGFLAEQAREDMQKQLIEKEEDAIDREDIYKKRAEQEVQEQKLQIEKLDEFLNAPENKERAKRLKIIWKELNLKDDEERELGKEQAVWENTVKRLEPDIETQKKSVMEKMEKEVRLRKYFDEELSLGLVFARESKTTPEAAKQAKTVIREADRNKSVAEIVSNMDRIFHAHIGSLVIYGTFMEDCFAEETTDAMALRKRHRIVSYMQGRKLYFEEFYQVIKERIDETQLLIRQKDRELFENILSDTLSRKLNVRIAESRKWIQDMSSLMRKIDTSMSLTFSLDWRAKTAGGEGELDTAELEKMLNRDRELMTAEDIERISAHFRNKIYTVKQMAEENGEVLSYTDLVREALDYRKWFEFKMFYYRNDENKKELTNGAFNRFSGGEKAMAMYVPLFAALNAQYKKAEPDDLPRIIALDEAFAGVDDKNISSMFDLVRKFDFDFIMNSQVLWGCYASVPFLRIAELLRPANSKVVTVIYYLWNGKQRIIEE
ncbi:TIGR02680 family protein [Lachnospiraceae bacterium WCA-9-b2]|uniref:TIGR02680 family protein n=2 Tax=Sporofaciens musculi TaxID=2681861 RepID=A0A7X3MLG8_9FIRM|nr:TIGR02680 family protein [Sporofaciens musculi]MXP78540.1 TIGR02680 family protein [Sporofaciens musculi]